MNPIAAICLIVLPLIAGPVAAATSGGSGFFVTRDGHFVTNYHVIENAKAVYVSVEPGKRAAATIVVTDPGNDLAILKVEGTYQPPPIAESRSVRPGAAVMTMGYPMVSLQRVEPKVTEGVISSVSGLHGDPRFFQITVQVQPGNSGGPLVNREGNVVGIVSARLDDLAALRAGGSLPQDVNFAVKSAYLLEVLYASQGLGAKLPTARRQRFPDTEQLAVHVGGSVGRVTAERPDPEPKPTPTKESSTPRLPREAKPFSSSWRSRDGGAEWIVRVEGDQIFWQERRPSWPLVWQAGRARVTGGSRAGKEVFEGYDVMRCAERNCELLSPREFTSVSPSRIEGRLIPSAVDCGSCTQVKGKWEPFVWDPE